MRIFSHVRTPLVKIRGLHGSVRLPADTYGNPHSTQFSGWAVLAHTDSLLT